VSTNNDAIEKARTDVQNLHKQLEASAAKNQAALRTDVQNAGMQAQKLADALRTAGEGQHAEAQRHLKDAAARLDEAAKHARDVAGAGETQLKETNQAMLSKARDAVQKLSEAIASRRTAKV